MMDDHSVSEYISKDVLAYEPTEEEIKFYHKNNLKSIRYIFCGKELDDFEKQKIKELKDYVDNLKLKEREKDKEGNSKKTTLETYESLFKDTIFFDDNYVLRFLQGNEFIYEKCYNDMLRHLKWRQENLPIQLGEIKEFLNKGYCYIHGRDKQMHPIIIINCKNIISANTKDVLSVLYYWLEFCISKLLIEGKIEQWRVIIDLTSCSVLNIPISALKDISRNLSCNYRSRLSKMLVLSAPLVVTGIWHMLKSIIPVVTQQKITITSSEIEKKLLDQVHLNQLEKKFGGTCNNVTKFDEPILP
ncbi:CRAL/TRIO domain-containing protein, putative [Plasmodium relictum]|uniref:CRAL/TRIO domain-containing protein, putative n=1 Tax=Plasmodium relictum TaxID=85471 RepID=A0A1J1H5W3_PLARL|nr:CRAL/TRIO domain-containing protein, putative [Plasmodium relictum]CRH00146.1 CRAL/TRIO domain-containing protein, putative [Plasmodium relictum]